MIPPPPAGEIRRRITRLIQLGIIDPGKTFIIDANGGHAWDIWTIAGDHRKWTTAATAAAYLDGLAHGSWAVTPSRIDDHEEP